MSPSPGCRPLAPAHLTFALQVSDLLLLQLGIHAELLALALQLSDASSQRVGGLHPAGRRVEALKRLQRAIISERVSVACAAPGGGGQGHGSGGGGLLDLLPLPLLGQLLLSQGAGFLLGLQPLLQLGDGLLVFLLGLDGTVEPEGFDAFFSVICLESRLNRAKTASCDLCQF